MLDIFFKLIKEYLNEVIATGILVVIFLIIRFLVTSLVTKFGKKTGLSDVRVQILLKYIDIVIAIVALIILIAIWGVEGKQVFLVVSSVFTVIGVALFAQWSILSNVTAGILLFFYFPFRIGDKIRILDKEFPIEAEIMDIKSFYSLLKTDTGELISYPNNLLLQKGIAVVGRHTHLKYE